MDEPAQNMYDLAFSKVSQNSFPRSCTALLGNRMVDILHVATALHLEASLFPNPRVTKGKKIGFAWGWERTAIIDKTAATKFFQNSATRSPEPGAM
jgi:hypothetical protein